MGEVIKGVSFGVEKSATDSKTKIPEAKPLASIDAVLAKTRKELKYNGPIDVDAPDPIKALKVVQLCLELQLSPIGLASSLPPVEVLQAAAKNMKFDVVLIHDKESKNHILGFIIGSQDFIKKTLDGAKLDVVMTDAPTS